MLDSFKIKCRENNLKITPQRAAVYDILKRSTDHPSADAIHKKLKEQYPNISLDTVNRTLLTFSRINLVDVVEGHGDPRRYEPNMSSHHHFYCLECGKIYDIEDQGLNRIQIPREIEKRFTITGKRLCLKGICPECKTLINE